MDSASDSNAEDLNNSNITLSRRGKTKNLFKKKVMDKIVSYCSDSVKEIYKERGPFCFKKHELAHEMPETRSDKRNITQVDARSYYLG